MLSCPQCPVVQCDTTVVISGVDVCCSVVFGTLWLVYSVMWYELDQMFVFY